MRSMPIIWRVALAVPIADYFDYLPCEDCLTPPRAGCRIQVPFGSRHLVGVLLEIVNETAVKHDKLKLATAVLDEKPLLDSNLLELCYWASDYYHCPLGEVIVNALPKALRNGKSLAENSQNPLKNSLENPLPLNEEQQIALKAILSHTDFKVSLLAGVTGSGKTEVYLQAISAQLQHGKSALVLVPEINLTPQTVSRFEKRFSIPVIALHSGLTDSKRAKAWAQIYHSNAAIVIGTRSAIFAPLRNLGIIIIDEEHDASFKSQKGLRYSGRDLAIVRAQFENIPVVLGTATPSIESYYNALRGRYQLLELKIRAGNAQSRENPN